MGRAMTNNDAICLRPVEEGDLEVLGRIDTDPAMSEPFEWRGFRDPQARRRRWETDGYLGRDDSLLIVALPDGAVAGIVIWRRVGGSGPPEACFEIGILLFPDHRGKGLGTAAQRLLADHLFSTTLANRLEATTEADNLVEQRALQNAGFVREALLRERGFVRGRWVDAFIYARLRADPAPTGGTG